MNPRKAFEQAITATREEEYDTRDRIGVAEETARQAVKYLKSSYRYLNLDFSELKKLEENIENVVFDFLSGDANKEGRSTMNPRKAFEEVLGAALSAQEAYAQSVKMVENRLKYLISSDCW